MKNHLRSLFLAAVMFLPFAAMAQTHTLTVANGTVTNDRVPIFGFYIDAYNRCQTIYPASVLESASSELSMTGGSISSITYYLSQTASNSWGNASFVVKVMEVENDVLSGFVNTDEATVVYTGSIDGTQSPMTITFATPYNYMGGNLLVEVANTATGTYLSCGFYGVSTAGAASWHGYSYSGLQYVTGDQRLFMPKTTFTFTGGGGINCHPVQNLHITNHTSTTMSISWADTVNDPGVTYNVYNILNDSLLASGLTATNYTATGLTPNSLYGFKVEARCSANDSSFRMSVAGRTACAEYILPYVENFDLMPHNFPPTCWQVMNGEATVHENLSNAHSGEYFIKLYGSLSNMIAMPGFNEDLNGKQLYCYVRPENLDYRCGSLSVGYVTNLADTSSFVSLAEYGVAWWNDPISYHEIEVNYDSVPAGAIIAFRHNAKHVNYFWYIDDVEVRDQPSCFRPRNVHLKDATHNSATIAWTDPHNTGATYSIYTWPDSTLVATGVSDTFYTVTGLSSNTAYTYAVLTNCTASDASRWAPLRVRTNCDTLSIPYTETFESSPLNNHPLCWYHPTHVGDSANVCIVRNTSPHAGQRSLFLSYGLASGNMVMMPELAQSLNGLRLRFWYRAEHNTDPRCGTMEVGYVTNDVDTSTFVALDTLNQSTTYARLTVAFSDVPDGSRIAFRHRATGANYYWVIDDIVVEPMPDCADISHLNLENITDSTATVSWWATTATAYGVELFHNDTVAYTWTGAATQVVLPVVYDQDYTMYVRGYCNNDTTEWSDPLAFHVGYCRPGPTSCDGQGITNVTFGIGEVMNSNNRPTSAPYYGNYSHLVGALPANMTAQVNITFSTGYTYGTVIWIDWDKDMMFEDDEIVYTGTSLVSNPTTLQATFPIDYSQDTGYYRMRIGTADSYFDNFINTGEGPHDPCATPTYCVFMDYTVHITAAPACMPATDLTVSNIHGDSATLSWNHVGTATYAVLHGDDTLASGITTTSCTLTGLDLSTYYEVYVMSYCPGGDEYASTPISFITPCAPTNTLPFTESFELTSGTVDCWDYVSMNAGNDMGTSNGMGFASVGSNRCIRFSSFNSGTNYNQYAYSPVFTGTNPTDSITMTVRFSTYNNGDNTDQLFFGYVTADDTVIDALPHYTSGQNDIQYATFGIPGTANRAVINYYGNYKWYAWVDSVHLEVTGTLTPQHTVTVNCDTTRGYVTGAGTDYVTSTRHLTAIPYEGYYFAGWQEGGTTVSTANPYSFANTADRTLTALFQPQHLITVNCDSVKGSVTGAGYYNPGDLVNLVALANEGYLFLGWQEGTNTVSNSNPYSFNATSSRTLTALFLRQYTITVLCDSTMGSVDGGGVYDESAAVTLTATPAANHVFVGWQENDVVITTTNPYVFTAHADRTITALFEESVVPLDTVVVSYDPAKGSVTGAGIYAEGTTVTLEATPNTGFLFTGWLEGTNMITENPYTFTVTANRAFTAVFQNGQVEPTQYTVTVTYDHEQGIVYGTGTYDEGTTIHLEAVGNEGYAFDFWLDGTEMIRDNPYIFTLNSDRAFTAVFKVVTGIGEVTGDEVTLYPNPASTTVTLSGLAEGSSVTLLDLNGRENGKWRAENGDLILDVSGLAKGAYFVRIVSPAATTVRKLIVK